MKETTTDYQAAIGLFVNLAGIEASDAYGNGELEDETVTLTLAPDQAFEILLALGNRAEYLLTEFDPPLLATLAVVEETQAMVREAIGSAR